MLYYSRPFFPIKRMTLMARYLPLLLALLATPLYAQALPQGKTLQLAEQVLGDPAAPVTIIEYASYTCTHCAHFQKDILPRLIDTYISTGKVKLVYRDFPLDAVSLKGAQLANCLPRERFFGFIKTLYANQDAWLTSGDPVATLKQYAMLAGLSRARADSCLADTKLQDALVSRRLEAAERYNITGTPAFVINYGEGVITGASSFETFEEKLKKYVK